MTVPDEEVRAIEATYHFLVGLSRNKAALANVRAMALRLLRHYPWPGRAAEVYIAAKLLKKG